MIKVLSEGLYTTIQDSGRFRYRHLGVPVGGYLDEYSAEKANLMIGNIASAALMEITLLGPTLKFQESTFIAITGLEAQVYLNNELIPVNTVYQIKKNDILSIKQITKGSRLYISVKGGFKTKKVLGSRSYFKNITNAARILKNDELPIDSYKELQKDHFHIEAFNFNTQVLEVSKGPEFEILSEADKTSIFSKNFTISNDNNRMGYRLNETISTNNFSIITSGTIPGVVQLTPKGELIVLMKDGQTTGGYPRVFLLSKKAINILAQKHTNDTVKFELK
ncbi:biotin-dependent carboxyltransferase family protein [Zhouia sp. PK063]|uniref:biotin-dependent carboxyltransferase family protein n=1 Tax=Zhouia sp. PK063 TaxID=3373602 RepID=UPI0037B4D130